MRGGISVLMAIDFTEDGKDAATVAKRAAENMWMKEDEKAVAAGCLITSKNVRYNWQGGERSLR